MALRQVIVLCLLLAVASVKCADIKVTTVPSMETFLEENPDVEFTPLELVEEAEVLEADAPVTPFISRTYRFGYRAAGDRLLAQDQAQQQWSTPQNVTKNLYYPQHGIGGVITHVEISVVQSSNLGQARIIGGGIGQRQISVVIEARSTLYFAYRAAIYGY